MEAFTDDGQNLQGKNYSYEEDFLDNKTDVAAFLAELICGVCNNILKNPQECKVCEKPICSECKV